MLRRDLEEHPIYWNDQMVVITASFGIAEVLLGEDDSTAIIARADAALYRAKQLGRNRVIAAEMSAAQAV
jgi:diguanylate cyclase (GGDEF)-like protein